MRKHSYGLVSSMLVAVLVMDPLPQYPTGAQAQNGQGQGNLHRNDPCDQVPDPPGEANGIHERCSVAGSSNGVAKGDFNGDGFADLAIGVPDEDIGSTEDAGAVNIIYGSANGLTTGAGVPASQFWSENTAEVPRGAETNDHFGESLAAGDFNGDGFSDLAVGIPSKRVITTIFGVQTTHNGAGAVAIIYGSSHGLTATDSSVPDTQYCDLKDADPAGVIHYAGAHFGRSLAWGNFNGDETGGKSIGDLAIGIPNAGLNDLFGNNASPNVGAVWVVLGDSTDGLTLSGSLPLLGDQTDSRFGNAITSGNFNGDNFSDLAIGASSELVVKPGPTLSFVDFAGKVFIVNGSSSAANLTNGSNNFAQVWTQESPGILGIAEKNDHFGDALAARDFNGDGKSDLAIGVPLENIDQKINAGVVNVIYGSNSGLSATAGPGNQIWSLGALGLTDEAGAHFGSTLAAGDFNQDERADLAIGVPLKNVSGIVDAGQVNVIYGSSSGLALARTPQTWTQRGLNQIDPADIPVSSRTGDHFGSSLSAWNFGNNFESDAVNHNTADLAIGAPFETVGTVSEAGVVIVLYGSFVANGLVAARSQLWSQNSSGVSGGSEKDDHFGGAVY